MDAYGPCDMAPGWRAALYILRSRTFGRNDARLWAHVDLAHGNLWFDRIRLDDSPFNGDSR